MKSTKVVELKIPSQNSARYDTQSMNRASMASRSQLGSSSPISESRSIGCEQFPNILSILSKKPSERGKKEIQELYEYFHKEGNSFLDKQEKENGRRCVDMILREIRLLCWNNALKDSIEEEKEIIPAGQNIIEFGEIGTCFYIILKGKVEVRVPVDIGPRMFTLKELCLYIIDNNRWLIRDGEYERALSSIHMYIPDATVWTKKKFEINAKEIHKMLQKCSESKHVSAWCELEEFPSFPSAEHRKSLYSKANRSNKPVKSDGKRSFKFTLLTKVSDLSEGVGFGELALLNKEPRSATITTATESIFAYLEKATFKEVMGNTYKRKITDQMKLIENFMIINLLPEKKQERACILMRPHPIKFGKMLIQEGEPSKYIYLIINGQFELNKTLFYKHKKQYAKEIDETSFIYSQYFSKNKRIAAHSADNSIVSNKEISYQEFKQSTKGYMKSIARLLCFDRFEILGLIECALGCPYSVFDVKCLSNDSEVYKIRIEDFNNIIHNNKEITETIQKKISLLDNRIHEIIDRIIQKNQQDFIMHAPSLLKNVEKPQRSNTRINLGTKDLFPGFEKLSSKNILDLHEVPQPKLIRKTTYMDFRDNGAHKPMKLVNNPPQTVTNKVIVDSKQISELLIRKKTLRESKLKFSLADSLKRDETGKFSRDFSKDFTESLSFAMKKFRVGNHIAEVSHSSFNSSNIEELKNESESSQGSDLDMDILRLQKSRKNMSKAKTRPPNCNTNVRKRANEDLKIRSALLSPKPLSTFIESSKSGTSNVQTPLLKGNSALGSSNKNTKESYKPITQKRYQLDAANRRLIKNKSVRLLRAPFSPKNYSKDHQSPCKKVGIIHFKICKSLGGLFSSKFSPKHNQEALKSPQIRIQKDLISPRKNVFAKYTPKVCPETMKEYLNSPTYKGSQTTKISTFSSQRKLRRSKNIRKNLPNLNFKKAQGQVLKDWLKKAFSFDDKQECTDSSLGDKLGSWTWIRPSKMKDPRYLRFQTSTKTSKPKSKKLKILPKTEGTNKEFNKLC
ncbi:unnamed protein product [Moneuplotes crassus]|uniref:Cyclic nucleotide-binding domain-containing protein n=1 Tax=Euplotes crassus TaxID=5936 RepID=A0AAD1UGQ9_EUPCR|nr:unnamed protein product [Moneuplotes crassus]